MINNNNMSGQSQKKTQKLPPCSDTLEEILSLPVTFSYEKLNWSSFSKI